MNSGHKALNAGQTFKKATFKAVALPYMLLLTVPVFWYVLDFKCDIQTDVGLPLTYLVPGDDITLVLLPMRQHSKK